MASDVRLAMRELLRQPGRFVPVGTALTLLVVLLVVLGGFLDGLELSQTGAYRAHDGTILVFAEDAEFQIQRSTLPEEAAEQIAELDGVRDVGVLNQAATTAGVQGSMDLQDVLVFGYEVGTPDLPAPSADGAVVDAALAELIDLHIGDTLAIGPTAEPVRVDVLVDDLTQGAPTIWVDADRWEALIEAANPTALPPRGTAQALVVQSSGGTLTGDDMAEAVEGAAGATPGQVIEALPVVQQQSSTFEGIIGVTFGVTLLVIALFFALITLERTGLYAVLKAIGARSGRLLAGLGVQAIGISVIALVLGIALSLAFISVLPPELPIRLVPGRLALIALGTLVTSLIGSLLTLRRILRIDPADAIG